MHLQLLPGSLGTPTRQRCLPFNQPGTAPVRTRCKTTLLTCSQRFLGPGARSTIYPCSLDMGDMPAPRSISLSLCSAFPEGKRRSFVAVPTPVTSRSQRLILAESGTSPPHCAFSRDGGCVAWETGEEPMDFGCKGGRK